MTDSEQGWDRLRSLWCKYRGHDWERVPHIAPLKDRSTVVGECSRCGHKARSRDYLYKTAGKPQPPRWLLDLTAEEELKAAYVEGHIDEEELERMSEEVLADG